MFPLLRRSRGVRLIAFVFVLILVAQPALAFLPAAVAGESLISYAIRAGAVFVAEVAAGKVVDRLLIRNIEIQLEEWFPFLKADAEAASGENRARLQAQVLAVARLLAVYKKIADQSFTRAEAAVLRKELGELDKKFAELEGRTRLLELQMREQDDRIGRLEQDVGAIREILQAECKDMTGPDVASVGHFLVQKDEDSVFRSFEEYDGLWSRMTIYLNACSEDRASRGILIFLQTTTDGYSRGFEAAVTFKDLEQVQARPPNFNWIFQKRIKLFRPGPGKEGRITTIFLPHETLPTSQQYGRLGLAVVLMNAGQPLFSAERGLSCYAGRPLRCDWI